MNAARAESKRTVSRDANYSKVVLFEDVVRYHARVDGRMVRLDVRAHDGEREILDLRTSELPPRARVRSMNAQSRQQGRPRGRTRGSQASSRRTLAG